MPLSRNSISTQAATAVRRMIVKGELADGHRINEVRLAEDLGVSRTPLREGLGQLVAERIVRAEARRGFFVMPLTVGEFEQLYDIRPLLDPEALQLTGVPSRACLDRLGKINRKMKAAKSPSTAIDLDDEWHITLLAECPNRVLVSLIQHIIGRTRRYEHALFRETANVWTASNEHDLIVEALDANDLHAACKLLKRNMQSGKEPIIAWLQGRTTSAPSS